MACQVWICHPEANQGADEGGWAETNDEGKSHIQVSNPAIALHSSIS
jgi:hypothetical protein